MLKLPRHRPRFVVFSLPRYALRQLSAVHPQSHTVPCFSHIDWLCDPGPAAVNFYRREYGGPRNPDLSNTYDRRTLPCPSR